MKIFRYGLEGIEGQQAQTESSNKLATNWLVDGPNGTLDYISREDGEELVGDVTVRVNRL